MILIFSPCVLIVKPFVFTVAAKHLRINAQVSVITFGNRVIKTGQCCVKSKAMSCVFPLGGNLTH